MRALLRGRVPLWLAFAAVHAVLWWLNFSSLAPMGDVFVQYRGWAEQAFDGNGVVGIDQPWVYPIVALVPILVPWIFGFDGYGYVWLVLVCLLDAVALATLTGWGRRSKSLAAGWWWTVFLLALGPIALGRIDTVSVALALVGAVLFATRPAVASVLITVAIWIKVWPAALIAAAVIALRSRLVMLGAAAGTSVVIVVIAIALGAAGHLSSFASEQTTRALQVEAPVSSIWLWRAAAGRATVGYHRDINTWEVTGPGTELASAIMTPLLLVAGLAIVVLGVRAVRRGADAVQLLPVLALAFVTCLIVVNKVGSPQYYTWLAVPIVLGIVARSRFTVPVVLALVIGVMTQLVYPLFYRQLLALEPAMLVLVSVRNLLIVALFAWSIVRTWRLGIVERRAPASLGSTND